MSLPIHWKSGDVADVRGTRATVRHVMQDGYVYVELGGGRTAVLAREVLQLPTLPPVHADGRLLTRRARRRRGLA